jgi:hypothetical protein
MKPWKLAGLAALVSLLLAAPVRARAHCDTLDGPVVESARRALDGGKLAPVLAWVKPADEAEIRAAFQHAVAVRKLGPEARALADRWFFETVVRVHRAGEGAPFTGLKPAGQDLGPAIPAADRAIASGSPEKVEELLVEAVRDGLRIRFAAVKARTPPADDVAAGRAWVEAYVPYMHWVEGVYAAAHGEAGGHAEHAEHAEAVPAGHATHAH